MTRLRILLVRFAAMFRKSKLERELEAELRSHIEMQAEDNIQNGMSPEEAKQSALRSFGRLDGIKDQYRDLTGVAALESIVQDIRYSLRALRQAPGFALTAIMSISLAIGANSAIFSIADGLLLRPLPVADPTDVVTLRGLTPSVSPQSQGNLSYADFQDYRDHLRSFNDWAVYDDIGVGFARGANEQPRIVVGYLVNGDFFRALGIQPEIGRGFTPEEDKVPGRDAVIVLGHAFWQSEFASDPSVVGRRVWLNGLELTVIGVAPETFTAMNQFLLPDFFVPIHMGVPRLLGESANVEAPDLFTSRANRRFFVKGRLKPGVSIKGAAREASVLAASLEQSYPATNRGYGATVNTEVQTRMLMFPGLGTFVTAMFVTMMVILLIACANVANLILSRGRDRAREIGVRLAIGISRMRLVRLLLMESLLIALAGGGLAVFVAKLVVDIISAGPSSADVPYYVSFRLDERVVSFTFLVSIGSALLCGLAPAFQSIKTDVVSALKAGGPDGERGRLLGRNSLVIAQIAGSMLLLVGATQFQRAFDDALVRSPGFRKDHRLTMRFDPGIAGYIPAQTDRFYGRLTERSLEIHGVRSAALTSLLPLTYMDMGGSAVVPEGFDLPPGTESVGTLSYIVDHHYLETMGVPIIAGRGFTATDRTESPRVAVVNEAFANEYLGRNAVGKRFRLNDRNGPLVEVVGVTVTGKAIAVIEPPVPAIYLPLSQNPMRSMTLVVETPGDPASLAGPLREMIHSSDPKVPIFWVRTMDNVFENSLVGALRLVEKIYNSAGMMGLILALVGLHAVLSYQVARRTREIGIRMALGAKRSEVIRMFLIQAGSMGLTGVCIGLSLSFVANRTLGADLGAPAFDEELLAIVALGMLLTTLLAAAISARRASRIEPQRALRQE